MVSRGDIWLVLSEAPGVAGTNDALPCLVVSPPEVHDHLGLVAVAPIAAARAAKFRVSVDVAGCAGVALLEQVRTVEKRWLTRRLGAVDGQTLGAALAILREMFAE